MEGSVAGRFRFAGFVLAVALALGCSLNVSCASVGADRSLKEACEEDPALAACEEGLSAEVRFFALVSDYAAAKAVAASYAESPEARASVVRRILSLVENGDELVDNVEAKRRAMIPVDDAIYEEYAAEIRRLVLRLNAEVARAKIREVTR